MRTRVRGNVASTASSSADPWDGTFVIRDAATQRITDIRSDIPLDRLEKLGRVLDKGSRDHGFFPSPKPNTTVYCMSDIHGDAPLFKMMLQHLTGLMKLEARAGRQWFHYIEPADPYHVLVVGDVLDTLRTQGAFTSIGERDEIDILVMLCCLRIMSRGKFRLLFGNHEIMNLTGDYRYAETDDVEIRRRGFQYPSGRFLRLLKLARPYGCVVVGKNLYVHGGMTLDFLRGLAHITGATDVRTVVRTINRSAMKMLTIQTELANDPLIKRLDKLYYQFRKGRALAGDPEEWVNHMYDRYGSHSAGEHQEEERRLVRHFILNDAREANLEARYMNLRSRIMWLRNPLESYIFAYQPVAVAADDTLDEAGSQSIVWNRDMSIMDEHSDTNSVCTAAEAALGYLNENSRHKIRTFVLGHTSQFDSKENIRLFRTVVDRTKRYIAYKPSFSPAKVSVDSRNHQSYVTGYRCNKRHSLVLLVDTGCSESFWHYHNHQVLPQILCVHHVNGNTERRTVRVSRFHKNQKATSE